MNCEEPEIAKKANVKPNRLKHNIINETYSRIICINKLQILGTDTVSKQSKQRIIFGIFFTWLLVVILTVLDKSSSNLISFPNVKTDKRIKLIPKNRFDNVDSKI